MFNVKTTLAIALALSTLPALLTAFPDEDTAWQAETTGDGTTITKRHETGSVVVGGKLYVLGGRRVLPVEVYRPAIDGWENLGLAPIEIHHFQPVAVGTKIALLFYHQSTRDSGSKTPLESRDSVLLYDSACSKARTIYDTP